MRDKALVLAADNVDLKLWAEIAYEMATAPPANEEPGYKQIAAKFDITPKQAIAVIAHPQFAEFFHNMQVAIGKHEFDRRAFSRLIQVVAAGHDRDAINASKLLAELVKYRDEVPAVQVNFNIDRVVRKLDRGEVVDAEVVDTYPGM